MRRKAERERADINLTDETESAVMTSSFGTKRRRNLERHRQGGDYCQGLNEDSIKVILRRERKTSFRHGSLTYVPRNGDNLAGYKELRDLERAAPLHPQAKAGTSSRVKGFSGRTPGCGKDLCSASRPQITIARGST